MYLIEDNEEAIRQVERMLGISQRGVYDKRIRDAVLDFQRRNGLEESGIVDYKTFLMLKNDYLLRQRREEAIRRLPFQPRFPYSIGDMGNDVGFINAILYDVMKEYSLDLLSPVGVFYSDRSERTVRALREIFGLKEGVRVDEELYYRLTEEQKAIKNENNRKNY